MLNLVLYSYRIIFKNGEKKEGKVSANIQPPRSSINADRISQEELGYIKRGSLVMRSPTFFDIDKGEITITFHDKHYRISSVLEDRRDGLIPHCVYSLERMNEDELLESGEEEKYQT